MRGRPVRLSVRSAGRLVVQAAKHVFLILVALVSIVPFVWMWTTALKNREEFLAAPFGLPRSPVWSNFQEAWTVGHFAIYWKNSIIQAVPTTLAVVALCTLGGYALAKLRFPGRDLLFYAFLIGLMIPFESIMIPLYYELRDLHILGTHLAAILPLSAFGLPFGMFMMRAFFRGVPDELADAARVDGCNEIRAFWHIMLPLTAPAVATLGIFQFMWAWKAFLIPLTYVQRDELRPLTVGLMMFSDRYGVDYALIAAGVTITSLPIIIVFVLFQRQFITGLTAGALRG